MLVQCGACDSGDRSATSLCEPNRSALCGDTDTCACVADASSIKLIYPEKTRSKLCQLFTFSIFVCYLYFIIHLFVFSLSLFMLLTRTAFGDSSLFTHSAIVIQKSYQYSQITRLRPCTNQNVILRLTPKARLFLPRHAHQCRYFSSYLICKFLFFVNKIKKRNKFQ